MKTCSRSLLIAVLSGLTGCANFALEEAEFCERNQEWCSIDPCGNGVREPSEACDDGNHRDGDGCNSTCTSDERCGNGIHDPSEACDDGNRQSGDGCSEDCRSNETCGNGYTDIATGERCDDGNNVSGDGCSRDCRSNETCGNGYKDPQEDCDDGNKQDGDPCSADCRLMGTGCGNGWVEPPELCDDGDLSNENNCLNTCVLAQCGDGIVSPLASYPEQCDPGQPDTDTATCTRSCRISTCGDRYINLVAGEQCEDGNSDNCGTCNKTCQIRHVPSHASGFIDAAGASLIHSGETFTLDDGIHPPVVFEFTEGTPGTGRVKIPRLGSAADIAQAIIRAINDAPNLDIDASLDPSPDEDDRVLLWHVHQTSMGNRAITHTVQADTFFTRGMEGGVAGDCPATMPCTVHEDCRPGLLCRSGACAP